MSGELHSEAFWFREGEHVKVTATGTMQLYDETTTPEGVVAKTKPFWRMPIDDESHYGTLIGRMGARLPYGDPQRGKVNRYFLRGSSYEFVAPYSRWIQFGVNSGTISRKGNYQVTARVTSRS